MKLDQVGQVGHGISTALKHVFWVLKKNSLNSKNRQRVLSSTHNIYFGYYQEAWISIYLYIYTAWRSLSSIIGRCTLYTGVTNYRCIYCLRQSIKQTILKKPINNMLFNYLFITSMKINDKCFKKKLNLLKT